MLRYALNLELVTLAQDAPWPAPLSLAVELDEVVLIAGAGPAVSRPMLEVAATLRSPTVGRVQLWGRDPAAASREELYELRRRIAFISPGQVLLHRLTLGENIALGPCYHEGYSVSQALKSCAGLLQRLNLEAHLDRYPAQVSGAIYARAVWARELVKEPDLILASITGHTQDPAGVAMLVPVLQEYLARRTAAAILVGESLEPFYLLGHRLLWLEAGQLRIMPMLEHRVRPLTAYLPLV